MSKRRNCTRFLMSTTVPLFGLLIACGVSVNAMHEEEAKTVKQNDLDEIVDTAKLRQQLAQAKSPRELRVAQESLVKHLKQRFHGIDASISGPGASRQGARFMRLMMEWNPINFNSEDLVEVAGKPSKKTAELLEYSFDNGSDGSHWRFTIQGGTIVGVQYIGGE